MSPKMGLLLGVCLLAACGGGDKSKSTLADTGMAADQTVGDFKFDDKREAKLDQNVLGNEATKGGDAVVTLYFDGGMNRNCARWTFKIKGDDLRLAEGSKLDSEHQKLLVKNDDGTISGKFDTRGPMEGLRFIAPYKAKLRLSGLQDYCLTKDATEFDVKLDVIAVKRKRLFTGVETSGQTAVRVRITDAKPGEEGAEDEETAATAEAP